MPLYEYACKSCEHHFDLRHGANEKPEIHCPECAGEVRKVFHAAGIIFKGSGWYVTDSAKKSPASDSAKAAPATESKTAEKSSEAASSSSDTASTESSDKKADSSTKVTTPA